MKYYKDVLNLEPYPGQKEKNKIFNKFFYKLNNHHKKNCANYKKFIKYFSQNSNFKNEHISSYPFLHVNIFKDLELKSIKDNKVYKVMQSSGTSNQKLSKIFLDKENARIQSKILQKVSSKFLNKNRLPMLIIDSPDILEVKNKFSARSAAIIGFSIFAKKIFFAFKKDGSIDYNQIRNFLNYKKNNHGYLFGFTFLVWQSFFKKIQFDKRKINFNNCQLIHGGGWKKVKDQNISTKKFNFSLKKFFNLEHITNYYGMIEQTGSIFFECAKCNCFVTHAYSDIFIRNEKLEIAKNGKIGLVQLVSLLPTSYPGHNILTEDIGEIIENQKSCSCYLFGKRFKIYGRAKFSELRGCSDV